MKIVYKLLNYMIGIIIPKRPIVTTTIERVLVVKLCCIGDILFATPLVRALKANLPRVELSYMVTSWCKPLVEANQAIDGIIEYNAYDKMSFLKKMSLAYRIVKQLRQKKFDMAIVLHRTPLAGLLTALSGIPVRIGFDWNGKGFSYTHPIPFRADAHEIDRMLDCLKPLAFSTHDKQPELQVKEDDIETAMNQLREAGYKSTAFPLIAIFPGGGVNPGTTMTTKRWTLEGYRALCRLLIKHYKAQLVLIGSQEDRSIGDQIILEDDFLKEKVIRLEGKTTLMSLAGVLKKCDLLIGGDSGPLHMMDAVGGATVSIFGPTDPGLLAPRGPFHKVVKRSLECSPCFTPWQLDTTRCKIGTLACMTEISADDVFESAKELLTKKGYCTQ